MSNYFKEWKAQIQKQRESIDLGTYYKFDGPDSYKNKHYFLAEELLVPNLNKADAQRIQMFSSHLAQTVHLKNPEYPKVFTNFENQFGEYSIAYKKASEDFKIIVKIQKNALNYDLIIQYNKSKVYDVIHYRKAEHITEDYGYAKIDCLSNKAVGDVVHENEFVYKNPNYDEEGNFGYGVNLKETFVCWKDLTYEDTVVISKSAADKLTSYKVEESTVSINTNDILLNLYDNGQYNIYHSFPHVGENTLENVLVASRREENQSLLYNFQYEKMKHIEPNDDITYTNGGMVADIDIYCNTPLDVLRKRNNEFVQEVANVLEEQNKYYQLCAAELEKILPIATESDSISVMNASEKAAYYAERKEYGFNWTRPVPRQKLTIKYTEEFGYFWKVVHEYLDNRIQWRSKGKSFQNFKIKFTILKENKLSIGSKLTGRYGNKGVVSLIEHDDAMPCTEDGQRADIVLNSLGVLNRMNPAQLYEQFINFMSDHVVREIKKLSDPNDKIDLYLSYLKYLDKEEHDFIEGETILMNRQQKEDFIDDIEKNGRYVHQAPFFDNSSFDNLKKIYKEHPEWTTPYKCKGIEKPLVIGDIYFIRLKHESSNKASFVSADTTNNKNQPAKSNLKKSHKTLFANTPIRLGEMEVDNLLLAKSGSAVATLLKSYSTSKVERESLIKDLLTKPDPFNNISNTQNNQTINRSILEKYLSVLELSIEKHNNNKKK